MDGYTATVELVDTCGETGWGNRKWTVTNNGAVLATGYTLGSKFATIHCEIAMHFAGVLEFAAMRRGAQTVVEQFNPRAG